MIQYGRGFHYPQQVNTSPNLYAIASGVMPLRNCMLLGAPPHQHTTPILFMRNSAWSDPF